MSAVALCSTAQTYETQYERPVSDLMTDVQRQFNVRFKYNVDTVGKRLPYADFRVRPYSIEQTLDNICKYYDWNWWKQTGNLYKIKRYEYARRHEDEGRLMLDFLAAKYASVWNSMPSSIRASLCPMGHLRENAPSFFQRSANTTAIPRRTSASN